MEKAPHQQLGCTIMAKMMTTTVLINVQIAVIYPDFS